MRYWFGTVAVVVAIYMGVQFTCPTMFTELQSSIVDTLHAWQYDREVHFEGARFVKTKRLRALLPDDKTNFWWRMNSSSIARLLAQNPLVSSAEVSPCSLFALQCFTAVVQERRIGLLAKVADSMWLMGTDAGVISRLKETESEQTVSRLQKKFSVPIVFGIDAATVAPAVVKSRALYVINATERIAQKTGLEIMQVFFEKGGELRYRFKGLPFEVLFGSSYDSPDRLVKEIERFQKLRERLAGREQAVAKIDLALKTSAVVTLTEAAQKAQTKALKKRQ